MKNFTYQGTNFSESLERLQESVPWTNCFFTVYFFSFYRLQESVPWTMRVLGEAGVRVWMVTGDKLSTAKQVPESIIISMST
jgi:P-type E1-E2 ATPase